MNSKDKFIGVAAILIGIAFIALGVFSGMPKTTNNPQIYNEQQSAGDRNTPTNQNMNTNNGNEQQVEVYSEQDQDNTQEDTEEGSNRYIY